MSLPILNDTQENKSRSEYVRSKFLLYRHYEQIHHLNNDGNFCCIFYIYDQINRGLVIGFGFKLDRVSLSWFIILHKKRKETSGTYFYFIPNWMESCMNWSHVLIQTLTSL